MLSDTEQWEHDEQRAMEQEIEKLREKNQNLFNALMAATGKNDELHKLLKEQEGYDGICTTWKDCASDLRTAACWLRDTERNLGRC
ncbi:MAG: hypothetical protein IPJ52_09480 [Rhodocyclaceae bacterium]|nr:hypothetical protein [Rhodocyclaceae bacterium]